MNRVNLEEEATSRAIWTFLSKSGNTFVDDNKTTKKGIMTFHSPAGVIIDDGDDGERSFRVCVGWWVIWKDASLLFSCYQMRSRDNVSDNLRQTGGDH
jgi:hypothetical protein